MVETKQAATYQRLLVPAIFAEWGERLVESAALKTGQHVLDVACGTGVVAALAAQRVGIAKGGSVVGIDIDEDMLDVAQAQASSSMIEYRQGSADDLPVVAGSMDVVLCHQGFQFFPDREAAASEMLRVLSPGGRAVLGVWRERDIRPYKIVVEALRRVDRDAAISAKPFALPDADELNTVFSRAGFANVAVSVTVGRWRFPSIDAFVDSHRGIWRPDAEAVDDASYSQVLDDIRPRLAGYLSEDGLVFPAESHTVVAEAPV